MAGDQNKVELDDGALEWQVDEEKQEVTITLTWGTPPDQDSRNITLKLKGTLYQTIEFGLEAITVDDQTVPDRVCLQGGVIDHLLELLKAKILT